jgi:hypothetical protein
MQLAMTDKKNILTQEEASKVETDFRSELEAEHDSRQEAQQRRQEKAHGRQQARKREKQILAESEIKERVRAKFYKEKGYKLYTDSAGRQHWLTPEEYDWRMRARAQRDKGRRSFEPSHIAQRRKAFMYAGAALLAVIMGLILLK